MTYARVGAGLAGPGISTNASANFGMKPAGKAKSKVKPQPKPNKKPPPGKQLDKGNVQWLRTKMYAKFPQDGGTSAFPSNSSDAEAYLRKLIASLYAAGVDQRHAQLQVAAWAGTITAARQQGDQIVKELAPHSGVQTRATPGLSFEKPVTKKPTLDLHRRIPLLPGIGARQAPPRGPSTFRPAGQQGPRDAGPVENWIQNADSPYPVAIDESGGGWSWGGGGGGGAPDPSLDVPIGPSFSPEMDAQAITHDDFYDVDPPQDEPPAIAPEPEPEPEGLSTNAKIAIGIGIAAAIAGAYWYSQQPPAA